MATKTRNANRKHARDYAPFKNVSAYVVFRPNWEQVATIHVYFGNSNCVVTIYAKGADNPDNYPKPAQVGSAGGYGYDKLTAALSGLTVDGIELTDHCGERLPLPEDKEVFPRDFEPPKGYSLANYSSELGGWRDCYRLSGLKYLKAIGYHVIQAC